jgi:hypothetical protein
MSQRTPDPARTTTRNRGLSLLAKILTDLDELTTKREPETTVKQQNIT